MAQNNSRRGGDSTAVTDGSSSMLGDIFKGGGYGEKPPERLSRDQEARAGVHDDYGDLWVDEGVLQAPPPRPGFVQRWMRTKLSGEEDARNLSRKYNRGWRPRAADTLPAGQFAQTIRIPTFGDVIGNSGNVLVERPEDLHNRYEAMTKQRADRQMESVTAMLQKTENEGEGMRIRREHASEVTIGNRQAPVADDE